VEVRVRRVVGSVVVGHVVASAVVVLRHLLKGAVLVVAVTGARRRKRRPARHLTSSVVVERPVVVILAGVLRQGPSRTGPAPAPAAGTLRIRAIVLRKVARIVAAGRRDLGMGQGTSPPVALLFVPLAVAGHVAAVGLSVVEAVVAVAEVPGRPIVRRVARPVWKGRGRRAVVRLGRQVSVA